MEFSGVRGQFSRVSEGGSPGQQGMLPSYPGGLTKRWRLAARGCARGGNAPPAPGIPGPAFPGRRPGRAAAKENMIL